MVLRVTNESIESSLGTIIMSIEEFCTINSHPFIASSKFDAIVVDLDDSIPSGYLKHIVGTTKLIPRIVGPITTGTIRLLAEIYPDQGPRLRYTFLSERANIGAVISELAGKFRWDKFY